MGTYLLFICLVTNEMDWMGLQATEEGESGTMIAAMSNEAAQLRQVDAALGDLYLQSLMDALVQKKESTHERSLNEDFSPDVYDHLLTAAEIQEQLDSVNRFYSSFNLQ